MRAAGQEEELTADQIFDKVNNSVVVVLAYAKNGDVFQGSGVVINNNGYIATNYHVCEGSVRVEVKHYQQDFKYVEAILKDEQKDLLILKIHDTTLAPITISSTTDLKPGQRIYAIGSPEGYENSISEGIISGFRYDENGNKLLQTTAPTTEGSSGGALVNDKGELIGLSMSGQHEGSLYFAVPSEDIVTLVGASNVLTSEKENQIDYFEEGQAANENQDYKEAELYFTKYLEKFSNDIKAYFSRGYSRIKLREYSKAVKDFTKAIESNPNDNDAYFYRGNCYYSLRQYDYAVDDYSKCIEIAPDYADYYYNRGYAYFKLQKYTDAANDWETCIQLNPDYTTELTVKIKTAKQKIDK